MNGLKSQGLAQNTSASVSTGTLWKRQLSDLIPHQVTQEQSCYSTQANSADSLPGYTGLKMATLCHLFRVLIVFSLKCISMNECQKCYFVIQWLFMVQTPQGKENSLICIRIGPVGLTTDSNQLWEPSQLMYPSRPLAPSLWKQGVNLRLLSLCLGSREGIW